MEDLIAKLINKLPERLKNDLVFKSILDRFLELDLNEEMSIWVGETLKDKLDFDDESILYLPDGNILLYLGVTIDEKNIGLDIRKNKDGEYFVSLQVRRDDVILVHGKEENVSCVSVVNCTFRNTEVEVQEINEVYDDNLFYHDFNCNVKFYDLNGKPIKGKNIEKIKDEIFAAKFQVSENKSRVYRLNFLQYRYFLNEHLVKYGMKTLDDNGLYVFSCPFVLKDLETVLIDQIMRDDETDYDNADYDDSFDDDTEEALGSFELEDSLGIDFQKIGHIKKSLENQIGLMGEVVMSENLLINLITYAGGNLVNYLDTKGYVINRIGDKLLLYYVCFLSEQLVVMPISDDLNYIQSLYSKSVVNKSTEGLKEFFGIDLNRS